MSALANAHHGLPSTAALSTGRHTTALFFPLLSFSVGLGCPSGNTPRGWISVVSLEGFCFVPFGAAWSRALWFFFFFLFLFPFLQGFGSLRGSSRQAFRRGQGGIG